MSISKEIIYVVTCDEIIDANAEAKSCDKETKTIPKNIVCEKKKALLYFICLFINDYSIIDSFSIYFCLIKYKGKQKNLLPY